MNTYKYICQNDKYKYFIDSIKINFNFFINCSGKRAIKIVSVYGNTVHNPEQAFHLTVEPFGLKVNGFWQDNPLSVAANEMNELFPSPPRTLDFVQDENVILPYARLEMKKSNIKISTLRQKHLNLLYGRIKKKKKEIAAIVSSVTGLKVKPEYIRLSLGSIEITWDIITPHGVEICKDQRVISNFKEITGKRKLLKIEGDNQREPAFSSSEYSENDDGPNMLVGFLTGSKSKLKIYTKAKTKHGYVNRVERQFPDRASIVEIIDGNSFDSRRKLKAIIQSLASDSFSIVTQVLETDGVSGDGYNYEILENQLLLITPKWTKTILSHVKEGNKISTKAKSPVPNGAVRIVAKLRSEGRIFRKGPARGYAYVDWNQVLAKPPQ